MPTVEKRIRATGREPIPKFAKTATLCWSYIVGDTSGGGPPGNVTNGQGTMFDVACLAMFPHPAGAGGTSTSVAQPLSISFWSYQNGNFCRYGDTQIKVPMGAEFFSVAWLRLNALRLADAGPWYEDVFRIRWGLSL